jgi:DNA polymerase
MNDRPAPPIPARPTLPKLRGAVQECRACDLWEGATQAVMGEGARHAAVMLVGEQPGDKEDLHGHPFVGPAGGVLDEGLERAGIAPADAYISNVV